MSWNITGAPGKGEDLLYSQAGTPTLDQRFASSKSLIDYVSGQNLITFSRGSDRSIITSAGEMDVIGSNLAGFSHDPFTLESLGLHIEELRSNLLLNSAAPASQNITVAATTYTLSFYGSGDIVLTGAHSATVIGTGAFPNRRILTFTTTAGTLGVAVSGTVEFANLEPGSFATSWIPTGGSTATRNADVASITGTNFSRWYSQSAGSIYADWIKNGAANFQAMATLSDGTTSNGITLGHGSGAPSTNARFDVNVSGSSQASLTLLSPSVVGVSYKTAGGYAVDNFAASVNGLAPVTDTSGTLPTTSQLVIGANGAANGGFFNGTLRRLCFWPTRLPNATLQAITA